MVPEQEGEIQEAGEAVAKSPSTVRPSGLQRRHDEEHLPRGGEGIPALPPSHGDQPLSAGEGVFERAKMVDAPGNFDRGLGC